MNVHGKDIKIFSGNSNLPMATSIARALGLPLGKSEVSCFADGETWVSIGESVRGSDVFVVQSTSKPVNDHLMELMIMIDALKRASAGRITAVMPYFGYARQDYKSKARDPISAKLVADLITASGADRILTMDLHAPQIQGFFNIPLDHLLGVMLLSPYFRKKFEGRGPDDVVVVSPDLGAVTRSRKFAERFDAPLAIIDKRRPRPNVSEVKNIIGDVRGKKVILVDDLVDTAGSFCNAAIALLEAGATEIYACATHGVLSPPALQRIEESPIKELVLLDTVRKDDEDILTPKIAYLSAALVFAEAIERIYKDKPVSQLFG